jgi:hypothetical protein
MYNKVGIFMDALVEHLKIIMKTIKIIPKMACTLYNILYQKLDRDGIFILMIKYIIKNRSILFTILKI